MSQVFRRRKATCGVFVNRPALCYFPFNSQLKRGPLYTGWIFPTLCLFAEYACQLIIMLCTYGTLVHFSCCFYPYAVPHTRR